MSKSYKNLTVGSFSPPEKTLSKWNTGGMKIPNHNDQNCPRFAWTPHPAGGSPVSKFQTCFCHWILEFGAWNLIFCNAPTQQPTITQGTKERHPFYSLFHVKHWLISRRYFSLKIGSGVLLCASTLRLDRTGAITLQVEATLKLTQ